MKDISVQDLVDGLERTNTSLVLQRYNDSTIRVLLYLNNANNTRYVCTFATCTKFTG